ncbi:hypothetical protein DIE12_34450 [Burkholderia sp. Bp9015]|nr:hypothetical protein DIE12_34450 [Burkholderia sp. Bp9015]
MNEQRKSIERIPVDVAKAIYRRSVDPRASDAEGPMWWEEVADEIRDVLAARTVHDAAAVIDWWHRDWSQVVDSPKAAAARIRQAARVLGYRG